MSRRILSQKEMLTTRHAVAFCYICGEPVPARDTKGRKLEVLGEHVVPRVLLGPPPNEDRDQWAVELDVHRACEQENKQNIDHWINLLQKMHIDANEEWPEPGHIRGMPLVPVLVLDTSNGSAIPGFTGLGDLFDGVWKWISGLHAALYQQFLSSQTCRLVLPPVPACSSDADGPSIQDTEKQSWLVRKCIQQTCDADIWDGINAWGGALEYRAVWWQKRGLDEGSKWVCFWTLSFPGLEEWSQLVLPSSESRPWHGNYVLDDLPAEASCLGSGDSP